MSRQRQSTAAPTTQATPRRPTVDLPAYESLAGPLNAAAQRAIATLQRDHSVRKLNEHIAISSNSLTEMAAAINDTLREKQAVHERRRARRVEQGTQADDDDNGEGELAELRAKVEGMTRRMEEHMRKTLDGQAYVEGLDAALQEVKQNVADQPPQGTQIPPSQRSRGQNLGVSDENMPDFDPTDPAAGSSVATQQIPGPSTVFLAAVETHKDRYQAMSLRARYAQNNAYIGFKRTLHDAQHGEDGPALPHPSTWFRSSGGSPAPGVTAGNGDNADEDDDDIAIAREKTSTKCPLTLVEFVKPVTSRKCPHSFEKSAILDMIEGSAVRTGGVQGRRATGEKTVRCPVSGCQMMLTKDDLHTDPLLLRRIRRLQAARQNNNSNGSPDGSDDERIRPKTQNGAESVASDSAEDIDDVDDVRRDKPKRRGLTPAVKAEKLRRSGVVKGRESAVPDTSNGLRPVSRQIPVSSGAVVMDLEDEDEDEDEDEEDEEEE